MLTLEQIIAKEKQCRTEGGKFGVDACKESIKFDVEFTGKNLRELLDEYVDRAFRDAAFNRGMILACLEMINDADNPTNEKENVICSIF